MTEFGGTPDRLRLGEQVGSPRRTAHEYVHHSLREGILRGTLAGGTRLVQSEIAGELDVSTTPVREALRDLATEGLVRLDAHRGAIVNKLTIDDLRDVHALCLLVEPEAMRQVATVADGEIIGRARGLSDQMHAENDPVRWTELNRAFHATLVGAVPSDRFRNLLRGLRDSAAPYVALALRHRGAGHFRTANDQHAQILEALAAGDSDRSAELTRAHVDLTLRSLEEARSLFDVDA